MRPDAIVEREAQTLLDRLLFLHFVQRKGWLNRQRNYLVGHFRQHYEAQPKGTSYLDQFLRPLYVKLSTEGSVADIPGHDLPFLNGGLFNDEYGDEQNDDTALEREIDQRVYRLYLPAPMLWQAGALTPDEIKLVEEAGK